MLTVWRAADDIELGSIKERFDRFSAACEVLTSLLSKESTKFDGQFYLAHGCSQRAQGPGAGRGSLDLAIIYLSPRTTPAVPLANEIKASRLLDSKFN